MVRYRKLFVFIISLWSSFNLALAQDTSQKVYSFSVDEITRLALQNNFDIQLAQYDAQIAKTKQGVAESIYDTIFEVEVKYRDNQRGRTTTLGGTKNLENDYNLGLSKKLPSGTTLDLDMTNARDWSNSTFATINPSHDSALELTLFQDLGRNFFGIQDRGEVKITKLDIQNSQYTSLEKIETKVAEVQKAYWDLVLFLERVKVEERMLKQAQELYELHKEKIKEGLVETPELLAVEANYHNRVNELLLVQNQAKTKANVLRIILDIADYSVEILPSDGLALSDDLEEATVALKEAFENREDYKRAKNDIDAQNIKLAMTKNNLWPEINLEASFARNGIGDHFNDAVRKITEEDNPDAFVGVTVSFPLENRKAKSEWDAAKIEKAKALVSLKLVERQIAVGIMDQIRTCGVFQEIASNAEQIAQLQLQKLEEEKKQFNFGRSDTDTIIRFQEDVIQAQWKALQDKFNFQVAKIDLRLKEGTLLNKYWKE